MQRGSQQQCLALTQYGKYTGSSVSPRSVSFPGDSVRRFALIPIKKVASSSEQKPPYTKSDDMRHTAFSDVDEALQSRPPASTAPETLRDTDLHRQNRVEAALGDRQKRQLKRSPSNAQYINRHDQQPGGEVQEESSAAY